MKNKTVLTIGLCAIALLTVALLSLFAQDKKVSADKQNQSAKLSKSIKFGGWTIPEIKDAEVIDNDICKMQNSSVARKLYKLKKRFYTQQDFYSLNSNGILTVETQYLAITTVLTYNYNEKTFAYCIQYIPYGVSKNGGRALYGFPVTVFYVDEDGDGKFESRYAESDFPNEVPDWVTKVQH
ncbi:MAG: hypothetical protein ABJA66_16015 [Actinomycetota bacterium]